MVLLHSNGAKRKRAKYVSFSLCITPNTVSRDHLILMLGVFANHFVFADKWLRYNRKVTI